MGSTGFSHRPLGICIFLVLFHGCLSQLTTPHMQTQQPSRLSGRSDCQIDRIIAREPNRIVESEAGVSEFFDSFENDELECAGVEAVRHTINPKGLLLPYYPSAPELVYVVRGSGLQGTVLPGCPETFETSFPSGSGQQQFSDKHQKVYRYKEGDILALPAGVVHWTYNDGQTPIVTIVLRDTSNVANQLDRNFRKFFLAGNPQSQQVQYFGQGPGQQQQPWRQPSRQQRPSFTPGQQEPWRTHRPSGSQGQQPWESQRPGQQQQPWQTQRPSGSHGQQQQPWETQRPSRSHGQQQPWETQRPSGSHGQQQQPWETQRPSRSHGQQQPWETQRPSGSHGQQQQPWETQRPSRSHGQQQQPWESQRHGQQQQPWESQRHGQQQGQADQGFNIFNGFDEEILQLVFNVEYDTVAKLQGQYDNRGLIVRAENFQVVVPEEQQQQQFSPRGRGNGIEETLCSTQLSANIASPTRADVYNPRGGRISKLNSFKLPVLNMLQLSAERGVLYRNAVLAPHYNLNAHSIIYITSGSSRLQIVRNDGSSVFDDVVREGQLIVVPQEFAVIKKAGEQGCEWIAFNTNENAMTTQLAGRFSYIRELPEEVLANSYDISRQQAKSLKYNRQEGVVLSPQSGSTMSKAKNTLLSAVFG